MDALSRSRTGEPQTWTWQSLREHMAAKYGGTYLPHELRTLELKWRKIFAQTGWSVKGP